MPLAWHQPCFISVPNRFHTGYFSVRARSACQHVPPQTVTALRALTPYGESAVGALSALAHATLRPLRVHRFRVRFPSSPNRSALASSSKIATVAMASMPGTFGTQYAAFTPRLGTSRSSGTSAVGTVLAVAVVV